MRTETDPWNSLNGSVLNTICQCIYKTFSSSSRDRNPKTDENTEKELVGSRMKFILHRRKIKMRTRRRRSGSVINIHKPVTQPHKEMLTLYNNTQDMYVCHIQARSCNHSCSRNAISITYSDYVFVALGIQHEMRTRRIVMWPIRLHNIFLHYLTNDMIFE